MSSVKFGLRKLIFDNKDIISIFFIVIIIFLGYYKIFLGANFLCIEDGIVAFFYAHGNAIGNGWRPDYGFGISNFFGEPGLVHAWSIYTLWEKIIGHDVFAYNSSVLLLLIFAGISQYYFLKRVVPKLGNITCFLAPLIVFGSLQSTFSTRNPIALSVATPLFLMLLYDYFKNPKVLHLFKCSFLLWFVLFCGNIVYFTTLNFVGILFSIIYYIYHKDFLKRLLFKGVLIYSIGVLITVLLGFWICYAFFLEKHLIGYTREHIYEKAGIINIVQMMHHLINLICIGWYPTQYTLLVKNEWLPPGSNCISSVIFPLVFLFFLFRKSTSFWEFATKWLIIITYIYEFLYRTFPPFENLITVSYVNFIESFPASQSLQIGLLGIFLSGVSKQDFNIKIRWGAVIQKIIAIILFTIYFVLVIFSILAMLVPELLPVLVSFFVKSISSKELITHCMVFNVKRLQETMHWYSLIFYMSSGFLIFLFIKKGFGASVLSKYNKIIAGVLILNAIMFSWTVQPLNGREIIWRSESLPDFQFTDRFYPFYQKTPDSEKNLEFFKKNWEEVEGGGHFEYIPSFFEQPTMTISHNKSYSQKNVAEFTYSIFNGDGIKRINDLRELRGGPLIYSELLNMGAVSYYYTNRALPVVPNYLSLVFKVKQLYIYKNLDAWPYYYLAEKIETLKENQCPENPVQGTAYVYEKDCNFMPVGVGHSRISLKKFSYGSLVFDYYGDKENILVIADAWHPFWKAKADGGNHTDTQANTRNWALIPTVDNTGEEPLEVIKANGIFKGVKLPPGQYMVNLYFDTAPFHLGIYVSIGVWILFFFGFFMAKKYKWGIPLIQSQKK